MQRWIILIIALAMLGMTEPPIARANELPVYVSSIVGNSGAAVSNHHITLPTPETNGDLLVSCLSVNGAPTITWPAGWNSVLLQSSTTVVTLSCAYRFDNGSLASTFIVTTSAPQGDANITYRIRNALLDVSPIAGSPAFGATSAGTINSMPSTNSETRFIIAVWGWFAGTVSTSSDGVGLNAYSPPYPHIQSQWNNAAGTGVVTAYTVMAADIIPQVSLNFGSSVTVIRDFIAVRPASSPVTTPVDYTPLWIAALLLLAYISFFVIAWYDDSVAWFIPAGIVMQLIAFQGWTFTADVGVALALSVVGIVTLLVPIGHALRGRPS